MYTPPLPCDNIIFNISGTYLKPASCGYLEFTFGDIDVVSIISHNISIDVLLDAHKWLEGIPFYPDDLSISTAIDNMIVDPLIHANADNLNISLILNKHLYEILPDIINEDMSIETLIDGNMARNPEKYHLPTGDASGVISSWNGGYNVDRHVNMPWNEPTDVIHRVAGPILENERVEVSVNSNWKTMFIYDNSSRVSFDENYIIDNKYNLLNISLLASDNHVSSPFGSTFVVTDESVDISWLEPGAKDSSKSVLFDDQSKNDKTFLTRYNEPGGKDAHRTAAWGPFSYYTLCDGRYYYPPSGCSVNFSFPNKYKLVPNVCKEVVFNLNTYSTDPRCKYDSWHSGRRDSYGGIVVEPNDKLNYPLTKDVYFMFNTVLVKEIITQTPIEVLSVDAKIDRSSWLWSFNVTVADKCYLDLIKPIDGVMGHIQITMNGYDWFCTVEGWSENRAFGSQAWTIVGRSPSMMFGDPIGPKKNGIVTTGKQGQTIIEDVVNSKVLPANWPSQFETWTTDFGIYNISGKVTTGFKPYLHWYIPENTVSYSDKNEIDLMKDLTSSIGAYIQTEPDENKFTVKPLYAHQPWDWETGNTNINWITLNESQMIEIGRSNELKPHYQAVHVVGESIGGSNDGTGSDGTNTAVHVEVRRTEWSTSTASYAPMVTNPYITSSKAGLEYGRMVVAQTGDWIKHTLRIGALCSTGENFGLFNTGDMVSILERGTNWQGQVTGVQVMAANAGAGFVIEQVIEVEEYKGE